MIATALVFALGALVAGFIALIFAPILWSNAQRLARREFEAAIPASVREMRGEVDAARARAAFELRREAMRNRTEHETVVRERAEAGRAILENGQLLARQAELERQIADSAGLTSRLEEQIGMLAGERESLLATRQDLHTRLERREGELASLAARHQALSESFDEQRFRLAKAEARLAELGGPQRLLPEARPVAPPASPASGATSELPPAVEAGGDTMSSGSSRLRAAIARTAPAKSVSSDADHAEIRERIGDIAARIIHERIKVEGSTSPLARIITDAPPPADAGEPLLADRVRRLQADEAPVTAAPPKPSGAGRARRKSRR